MRVKELRKRARLRQKDVALALGLDRTLIVKWESGGSSPRADVLPDLARVLGCTIDELYGLPASAPGCEDARLQVNLSDLDEVTRKLDELTQGLIEITQLVRKLGEAIRD